MPDTETTHFVHPTEILMNVVISLMAPMFLTSSNSDIAYARMAAIEVISAYRASNLASLIAVAQIVAFGLAALGSLSLSLADDVSIQMALRLRGNANALNRSAEQNRRAYRESQALDPAPSPPETSYESEPETDEGDQPYIDLFMSAAAEHLLATEAEARLREPGQPLETVSNTPATKQNQAMWAAVLTERASEIIANIPNLAPAQRDAATVQATILSGTASQLMNGLPAAPSDPG